MILPTLQWRGSEPVYGDAVDKFLSDSPPSSQALFGCAEENIRRRNYTCTGLVYRPALDSLLDYSSAFIAQLRRSGDRLLYSGASGTMNEGSLTFTLNITDDLNSELGVLSWAPNRQVIRNLSGDFLEFYNMSQGLLPNSSLAEYNNSLQVLLQRYGPILRFFPQGREGNLTTTIIDEGRSIRCYTPIIVKEDPTSCFRVGKGWNESNSQANFTIGSNEHGIAYPVVFDAFYSDKATVFPQPFIPGQGQAACLPNGTAPADLNCDWDKIFSRPLAGVSSNFASSNFILETAIETDWREYRFYTQFSPALGFATYSTDVSVISTSLASLLIESYPDDPVPISVDSDWILAAVSLTSSPFPSFTPIYNPFSHNANHHTSSPSISMAMSRLPARQLEPSVQQ